MPCGEVKAPFCVLSRPDHRGRALLCPVEWGIPAPQTSSYVGNLPGRSHGRRKGEADKGLRPEPEQDGERCDILGQEGQGTLEMSGCGDNGEAAWGAQACSL